MSEMIFANEDGIYVGTSKGMRKISGYKHIGELPEGDWIMASFGSKFIVMADRSGKHLPYVAYDDKFEQMKLNEIEDGKADV